MTVTINGFGAQIVAIIAIGVSVLITFVGAGGLLVLIMKVVYDWLMPWVFRSIRVHWRGKYKSGYPSNLTSKKDL